MKITEQIIDPSFLERAAEIQTAIAKLTEEKKLMEAYHYLQMLQIEAVVKTPHWLTPHEKEPTVTIFKDLLEFTTDSEWIVKRVRSGIRRYKLLTDEAPAWESKARRCAKIISNYRKQRFHG